MAKKKRRRSGGDLGRVVDTYGGKSMNLVFAGAGAIACCGLVAILFGLFQPDYRGLAIFLGCVALVVAIAYVATNWKAVGTKLEVCEGGVREIRRDGTTELPWDQILKVEVGKVFLNHKLRWNVVIRAAEGDDIELLSDFWDALGGASRFAGTVRRFVDDVEYT